MTDHSAGDPPTRWLFPKAVTAFLLLPGLVAFAIPWWIADRTRPPRAAGIAVFAAGVIVLLWCVRDFYVAGRGSLAPWAPPNRLVVVGLYRISRNPMYVGVLTILVGWALMYPSDGSWLYAAVIAIAFQLRVMLGEEPWLAARYGEQWQAYRDSVPRWLLPPARPMRGTRSSR